MAPSAEPPGSPYHLPPLAAVDTATGRPEVSVSVVTYNQAHLLGRALDSILMQQVTFPYEIVVGDDGSTDGTRAVIEGYRRRYPALIRPILHRERLPGIPGRANNMHNPMACRGRYTAWLDGDDYWTDPNKLQRQYEQMQRYPELSCCLHDTEFREVDENGQLVEPPHLRSGPAGSRRQTGFYPHEEFCLDRNIRVHTSSLFFRTGIFGDWPAGYEDVVAADHYLFLLVTQRGPVYYDDAVMSVNERQPASLTNSAAYLAPHRVYQRLRDLRTYRRQFPATTITDSYATAGARWAKQLLLQLLRKGEFLQSRRLLAYLLSEPRGTLAILRHAFHKRLS